jgi:hypothetical protein
MLFEIIWYHTGLWRYARCSFGWGSKQNYSISPVNHIPCCLSLLETHLRSYPIQQSYGAQKF